MWLNPNSVTLGSTFINHVRCYGMNPRDQINILLYLWVLLDTLANSYWFYGSTGLLSKFTKHLKMSWTY